MIEGRSEEGYAVQLHLEVSVETKELFEPKIKGIEAQASVNGC